jgi:rare lipoprotein A
MTSVERGWTQTGIASWYGGKFQGRLTANGETYDMHGVSAAHKTLPFNTLVEVKNLDNGKKLEVRINDRGPYVRGRIIDLSLTAAKKIDMVGPGTAKVRIRVIGTAEAKGHYFTLQVAAYDDQASARALRKELERNYPKVRVESSGGVHRVLVGRFDKEKKAREVEQRLRSEGRETLLRTESGS